MVFSGNVKEKFLKICLMQNNFTLWCFELGRSTGAMEIKGNKFRNSLQG